MEYGFAAGMQGLVFSLALAAMALGSIAIVIYHTVGAIRSRTDDRAGCVLFSASLLSLFASLVANAFSKEPFLPSPLSWYVAVFIVAFTIFALTYTRYNYKKKVSLLLRRLGDEFTQLADRGRAQAEKRMAENADSGKPHNMIIYLVDSIRIQLGNAAARKRFKRIGDEMHIKTPSQEVMRKLPHMALLLFLSSYFGVAHVVFGLLSKGIYKLGSGLPLITPETIQNVERMANAPYFVSGHVLAIMFSLILLFATLPSEFIRLRHPELQYPFKDIILKSRRKGEITFVSHVYMMAGLSLGLIMLGWNPALWEATLPAAIAMILAIVLGDTAAALFGIRFGRHKLPLQEKKSWEGTIAGTLVTFGSTLAFVGIPAAAVLAFLFMVSDILIPFFIPVSDNLVNPPLFAIAMLACIPIIEPMIPFL
ncbi:MAG: hypothetical protein CVT48_02635 [Thermoplasmata archaeon HGW-Thermoplasmata-1]|nr:MAG: hypothetical protein CVT48_02635 [Thermoplasmata archaeon HGW-Thermoplasmata-1]